MSKVQCPFCGIEMDTLDYMFLSKCTGSKDQLAAAQARIAELETQNKVMREALDSIQSNGWYWATNPEDKYGMNIRVYHDYAKLAQKALAATGKETK